MVAKSRLLRQAARLPLLAVWLLVAWPFVLWLVHRQDPIAAVELAIGAQIGLTWLGIGCGVALALACLLYPPLPAWLLFAGQTTWRRLGTAEAPLRRALGELASFESAARHLEVARLFHERGMFEQGAVHAHRSLELERNVASAWHLFGSCLMQLDRLEDAAQSFANAEQLDPGHAFGEALLRQGRCQFLLQRASALELLQQHERRHGGGARSHLWLAEALDRAGDRAAATAALRVAAAKPPQRTTGEERLARARARVRLWTRGGKA